MWRLPDSAPALARDQGIFMKICFDLASPLVAVDERWAKEPAGVEMSVGWHEPLQLLKPVDHHDEVLRRGLVATAFFNHKEAPAVGCDVERPPKTRISQPTLEHSGRRAAAPRRSGLHP